MNINSMAWEMDIMPDFTEEQIKNEPMLFNCDLESATKLGGPITKGFLAAIFQDYDGWEWPYNIPYVIDTRVHMLMPGWYPCIPGWHHDDVPRTRVDGQPNYSLGQDRSAHCIALVNGDIAPTEFALGNANFPLVGRDKVVYKEWHPLVEKYIESKQLRRYSAKSNRLIYFDDRTWHRGTAAVKTGWRWFGRISRYWDMDRNIIARRNIRTNEVRRQVQVYMSDVNKGW